MVDLHEKDKGNISLPSRLQSSWVRNTNAEDEEHEIPIINMQTALYDVQIDTLLKKIKRLEFQNDELLDMCKTTDLATKNMSIETSDYIAQLNRQIFVETEKINEYKRQIELVEKRRTDEKQIHLNKVDFWNDKYTKTRLSLTSDIKVLNAKINTLEDYKITRIGLRNKLKTRNDLIALKEEEIKQKSEYIKRKFKIDREKFKEDIFKHLLGLVGTFQMEVADCTVKPVLRLMRENIVLKNELTENMNASLIKKEMNVQMKKTNQLHLNEIKDDRLNTMRYLSTVQIQNRLLKVLKGVHGKLKTYLASFCVSPTIIEKEYPLLIENVKDAATQRKLYVKNLELLFHREQVKLGLAKYLRNKLNFEVKWFTDILYDAKYAVICAFKVLEEDTSEIGDAELMSYLLNILIRGEKSQIQPTKTLSLESIPTAEDAYATGDLGFEPEHINLEVKHLTDKKLLKSSKSEFSAILYEELKYINLRRSKDAEFISIKEDRKDESVEEKSESSVNTEGTANSDEADKQEMEERKDIKDDKFDGNENKINDVIGEETYAVIQESDTAFNEEEIIHKE